MFPRREARDSSEWAGPSECPDQREGLSEESE